MFGFLSASWASRNSSYVVGREVVGEIVGLDVVGALVVGDVVGALVVGDVVGALVVGDTDGANVGAKVSLMSSLLLPGRGMQA